MAAVQMTNDNRFRPDATVEAIMPALERDGYVIIEGVMSDAQRKSVCAELEPYIEARAPGSENMMGTRTRRFGCLLARSKTVQELLTHPLVLAIADALLLPYCVRYQVNYTGVMYLEPGRERAAAAS